MNKNKIFDLFDDSPEAKKQAREQKNSLKEFKNSSYHKLGMFTKLIVNHFVFHSKLEKFLKKEEPNYNVESTKEASEYTVYYRAWHYIKGIDVNKNEDIDAIVNFNPLTFNKTLDGALNFFESYEEYEKCAVLKKYLDFLNFSS